MVTWWSAVISRGQTRMVLSHEALTTRMLSVVMHTHVTGFVCPRMTCCSAPVCTDHSRTQLSYEPEITILLSHDSCALVNLTSLVPAGGW